MKIPKTPQNNHQRRGHVRTPRRPQRRLYTQNAIYNPGFFITDSSYKPTHFHSSRPVPPPQASQASSTNSPPYTSSSSPPPRNPPCRNPREGYPESASTNPPESRNARFLRAPSESSPLAPRRNACGRGSCHFTVCTPRCQRKAPRNPHSQAASPASARTAPGAGHTPPPSSETSGATLSRPSPGLSS